jgi:hypothetical protein
MLYFLYTQYQVTARNADYRRIISTVSANIRKDWKLQQPDDTEKNVDVRNGRKARKYRVRVKSAPKKRVRSSVQKASSAKSNQWTCPVDAMIFFGDFNYRIELPKEKVHLQFYAVLFLFFFYILTHFSSSSDKTIS